MDKLRTESAKQGLKGFGQQVKGKVQETVGRATGDADLEAEGNLNQVGGRIREKAGEAGTKVADTLDPDAERDRNP
jgi:uncharacterized protein YjbJ (UPF0337 family)